MSDRQPLATAEQVSEFLGVPVVTLYQWRVRGKGPRGMKVGRYIRYRWADVDAWLDERYEVADEDEEIEVE